MSLYSSVQTDFSWFKAHLLSLVLVAVLIFGAVYGVDSMIARHDAANDSKWSQILKTQTDQNTVVQTQLAADEAQWAAERAQLLAVNSQKAQAIIIRDNAAAVAVQQVPTLSAAQTAQGLATQLGANSGEIVAGTDTITVDLPVAHTLLSDAILLPSVKADNVDLKTQLTNETTIATNAEADTAEQKKLVVGLQDQITITAKANAAQIASIKASARKSKFKYFIAGVVVGFIGKGLIKP